MAMKAGAGLRRKGRLGGATLACAALAVFVLGATPAVALKSRHFEETFGSAAKPAFGQDEGLAVQQGSGDLLVIDKAAGTLSRFTPNGEADPFAALETNTIDAKRGPGSKPCAEEPSSCDETPQHGLSFGSAQEVQVAVDESGSATDGNIYLTQAGQHLVDIFAADGHYLGQLTKSGATNLGEACGVAVDPSGAVYVGDYTNNKVHKYVRAANPPLNTSNTANFSVEHPCTLAAGVGPSAGALFAATYNGPVTKLDSASGAVRYVLAPGPVTAVSVDGRTGDVLLAKGAEVVEYDASEAGGAFALQSLTAAGAVEGLAADRASGALYVARAGQANVDVFATGTALAPIIEYERAIETIFSEATLRARFGPEEAGTSYRIEYGPTIAYGQSSATSVLGSEAPTVVGITLTGLTPGTLYHWRVVASSAGGTTDGPDRSFATHEPFRGEEGCANQALRLGAGAALPDCRAYEMVSPLDKAGSDIDPGELTTLAGIPVGRNQSDLEGHRFTYSAARAFGDAVSQPFAVQYMASRGGAGWSSHGISPPREVLRSKTGAAAGSNSELKLFSPDLCSAWMVADNTTEAPLAPGAEEDANNIYKRSNCGAEGYEWLGAEENAPIVQGVTADGSKTLYATEHEVFLTGGGEAKPICRLPDRSAPVGGCSAGIKGADEYQSNVGHALSADGRRIFWSAGSGAAPIYMRENPSEPQSELEHGAATGRGGIATGSAEVSNLSPESGGFEVGQTITARAGIPFGTTIVACSPGCGTEAEALTLSAAATKNRTNLPLSAYSACTEAAKACTLPVSEAVDTGEFAPEGTTRRATYWGAAADGAAVLFSLDPDDQISTNGPEGTQLYEYDAATRTPHPIAPDFLGLLGASEDLSRIYLVSEDAALDETTKGEGAQAGKPNLYLYRAGGGGSFGFIATLANSDTPAGGGVLGGTHGDPSAIGLEPAGHSARVSPDGESAAFTSVAPLSGYDNTDAVSGEADKEVFHYDARTGKLVCASCNPGGGRPEGRHVTGRGRDYHAAAQIPPFEHQLYASRALSENGNRLFFESFDPLVLRDNNKAEDVYEWEATGEGTCTASSPRYSPPNGGCLGLISSGENGQDSEFLDATPGGSDVFFTTGASLVGTDPGLIDIYDARVEGGFPEPPPPPAPCEGEACQSPPPAPSFSRPPSSTFEGPGDLPDPSRCTAAAQRAKRLAHRAARLRAGARAAARHGQAPRARRVARRAQRLARRAHGLSRKAKRCRRRERRQAR